MLVLSRKRDERIFIGEDTVIQVIDIRGDKVKLGIYAPKSTPVHREEVWVSIYGSLPKVASNAPPPEPPALD